MKDKQKAIEQIQVLKDEIKKLETIVNTPVNIMDIIKNPRDAFRHLNIDSQYLNELPSKYLIAVEELRVIRLALNEGWVKTKDNYGYYPIFERVSGSWVMASCIYYYFFGSLAFGSLLKSRKLAIYYGEQFIDLHTIILNEE